MTDHLQQALIDAARAGDVKSVERAVSAGATPDIPHPVGPRGKRALTIAAEMGHSDVVRSLLASGATATLADGYEWTPLRAAITKRRAEVVSILLEHGVDPNAPSRRGSMLREAVDVAAYFPSPAAATIVAVLLRAGAKLSDDDGSGIIHAVERRAAPAILRLLLENGADPDQRRSDGVPVLVLAVRRRDGAGVDSLLRAGADVNITDPRGRTALMHAVELGSAGVVAALLLAGADSGIVDDAGTTALHIAKSWHRTGMQFMLGERNIRPERVDARRTIMEVKPRTLELRGSAERFDLWALLLEHAVSQMGDQEYREVTGYPADLSRQLAARLRAQRARAPLPASWYVLQATSADVAIVRACIKNIAGGPPMEMPEGLTRTQVSDLVDELDS